MGRSMPSIRLSSERREEILLAQAVDSAINRLRPGLRPDAPDDELVGAVNQVLADLDESATTNGAVTHDADALPPIKLPIVLLDGLEVTQEVQDMGHSVPLIAGKATIVRAYLSYAPAPVVVRGEILVARSPHGPWRAVSSVGTAQLDPGRSGSGLANLRTRRANLGFNLNFQLPADLTNVGKVWIRMGVIRRSAGTPLPSLAGLPVHDVTFRIGAPLRLRLVRMRYPMGNPPVTYEPSATDESHIASWLRRAYPIARLEMTTTTAVSTPAAPFDASQINAQLIALRALDVSTGTDARTHYYGMVADGGFFMRGLASGIPQTPQPATVASGPTGPGTFGWDTDGSYGDWYGGHELGHTFGRFHAEFCGATGGAPYPFPDGQLADADEAFVGVDVGDPALGLPMRIMGGTTSHDVMSYCADEWLSSFTYGGIYDRLVAEDALPAGPGDSLGADAIFGRSPVGMHIIAALNLTRRTGSVVSVLPAGAENEAAAAAAPEDSFGVSVRVRDGAGRILDERPVVFQRSVCTEPGDDVTGVVDAIVPTLDGASSVELLVEGEVADSHPVGGETAEIGALVQPEQASAGADDEQRGDDLDLRWEAPDAPPPSQRYSIQVSDDGGVTWQTVATGLTEPAVTLQPGDFASNQIDVRVLATTGSRTAVVGTETVSFR